MIALLSLTVLLNIVFTVKMQYEMMKQSCRRKRANRISNRVKSMRVASIANKREMIRKAQIESFHHRQRSFTKLLGKNSY